MQSHQSIEQNEQEIISLPANTEGHDFIVADLHGNLIVFKQLISYIESIPGNHRLFLAGDLVDRGEDSVGLLEAIIDHPHSKSNVQIFAVRGNHENLAINAINDWMEICTEIVEDNEELTYDSMIAKFLSEESNNSSPFRVKEIRDHLNNHGEWFLTILKNELDNKRYTIDDNIFRFNGSGLIFKLYHYLIKMPYIIHVDDNILNKQLITPGFSVVHAGMPFGDHTLQKHINNNEELSDDDVFYCTCARPSSFAGFGIPLLQSKNRHHSSQLAYAGHNIEHNAQRAIRQGTNEISLDIGAYSLNVALLVDHTNCQASLIGNLAENHEMLADSLNILTNSISDYLIANKNNMQKELTKLNICDAIRDNNISLLQGLLDQNISPFSSLNFPNSHTLNFFSISIFHDNPESLFLMLHSPHVTRNKYESMLPQLLIQSTLSKKIECIKAIVIHLNRENISIDNSTKSLIYDFARNNSLTDIEHELSKLNDQQSTRRLNR